MKRIILVFFVLAAILVTADARRRWIPKQASATGITLLASTIAGSSDGNGVTTSAINTTGASILIAQVSYFFAGTNTTIADSAGNTWVPLTTWTTASYRTVYFYVASPTTSVSHTFTQGGVATFGTIIVAAFSGTSATPADQDQGAGSAAATSQQPGSITPLANNALVVSGVACSNSGTFTVDSSMTYIQRNIEVSGQHVGGGMAYIVQSTASAINPTWSWTPSSGVSTNIASFIP